MSHRYFHLDATKMSLPLCVMMSAWNLESTYLMFVNVSASRENFENVGQLN